MTNILQLQHIRSVKIPVIRVATFFNFDAGFRTQYRPLILHMLLTSVLYEFKGMAN